MTHSRRAAPRLIVAGAILSMVTGAIAQTAAQPNRSHAAMMAHETTANVGMMLPRGIKVVNDAGKTVDLRGLLKHGPVILIKLPNRTPCRYCGWIFDALQKSQGHSIGTIQARVVVLRVDDPGHVSMGLPGDVIELHSAATMRTRGFLAGHITPTAFYFNRKLKLIKRRPGISSAQAMLHFPATH